MQQAKLINYSLEPDWRVAQWFNARFFSEFVKEAVVLPDACPGGLLPTGTVAVVDSKWLNTFAFREAIGDIGCAMSYATMSDFAPESINKAWNEFFKALKGLNKTVLGSGNHFIDGCINKAGQFTLLVHVGSRMTTIEKQHFNFAHQYKYYLARAEENHQEIWQIAQTIFGRATSFTFLAHDTATVSDGDMILRKGVTYSPPDAPIIIASSFEDIITLGIARPEIVKLQSSMSHGTGRYCSRGEAKAIEIDQVALRQRVVIPDQLADHSWRLEAPSHYRTSLDILAKIGQFIDITDELLPIAFMGGF